ncbi:hypothetical protein B0O80DRAFT_422851 [Mortierella sp. GBAus27b]|nr:hypothetical protein B0O80DRAFT_422851 [Mortierella sp. GBAus27b]
MYWKISTKGGRFATAVPPSQSSATQPHSFLARSFLSPSLPTSHFFTPHRPHPIPPFVLPLFLTPQTPLSATLGLTVASYRHTSTSDAGSNRLPGTGPSASQATLRSTMSLSTSLPSPEDLRSLQGRILSSTKVLRKSISIKCVAIEMLVTGIALIAETATCNYNSRYRQNNEDTP